VVSIVVSILIIVVMVPRLSRIFTEANIQLPLITRIMVGISEVLTYSYILDGLVVAGLVALVVWFRATKIGSSMIASVAISTPLARDIVRRTILVRITRTLGTLLDSGVSIIEALTLAGKASGNERFQEALARVTTSIVAGAPIADSFTKERLFFPRMLVGLMAVGERTGKLAGTLQSIANFYERDVDERLKRFTALIEPLLLLVLGLVVGAIALSVLLPIYQLVGAVK
jgi:type II secretory pathway component PulF